ncbi:hypothetical protein WJX73_009400 [Symbiochloris irregularis]|uniref:Peptidylprolyl isomerase n=1 Tax=Symbiochloris irregularis TaxID=706552 RepID=A0AAW1PDY8_9CHLO
MDTAVLPGSHQVRCPSNTQVPVHPQRCSLRSKHSRRQQRACLSPQASGDTYSATSESTSNQAGLCRDFAVAPDRRHVLLAGAALLSLSSPGAAWSANPASKLLRGALRPELEPQQAVVLMLEAKGTLTELKELAHSPMDSKLRFQSRVLLPGMAKRLRVVGQAAPIVASLVTKEGKEAELSEKYGGTASGPNAADPVYNAIGQVVTISGRTISKQAQVQPQWAENAIDKIDALLGRLPADVVDRAKQLRISRLQMS